MKLKIGDAAPDFTYNTPSEQNLVFSQQRAAKHNVLMFSRYIGCSLCQLKLMEMVRSYPALKEQGAELFFVLQSTEENAKARLEELGVTFPVILDPEQTLYKLYDVTPAGSKLGLVSPKVIALVGEAKKLGIEHGEYEGEELQLPATFVVSADGVVELAHYGSNGADYPGADELAKALGA